MLDESDSVDSVLDEIDLVDADDVESELVDAESVEGSLVVIVIMELVDVIFGDWLDKDDVCLEGAVCVIIGGSSEHVESFSLILKEDKISFKYMFPYEIKFLISIHHSKHKMKKIL